MARPSPGAPAARVELYERLVAEEGATAPTTLVIPLHSRRRRARALQRVQDIIPAAGLMYAGVQALGARVTGAALALAITEVATSGLLLFSIGRTLTEVRKAHQPHAHAANVSWGEIWAASVLMAEWWERWHEGHHRSRPILLLAAVTLLLGLNHGRVARAVRRRRALTLTSEHFAVGKRLFLRRFRVTWEQLADISITPTEARVRTIAGAVHRIDLADLDNADEVRAGLEVARQRLARRAS